MNYDSDILRDHLSDLMRRHDISVNAWANKASMSESTLRSFMKKRSSSLQINSAVALANAINITLNEFLGITEPINSKMLNTAIELASNALLTQGKDIDGSRIAFLTEKLLHRYPDLTSLQERGPDFIAGSLNS